jgi:hypothetical protein
MQLFSTIALLAVASLTVASPVSLNPSNPSNLLEKRLGSSSYACAVSWPRFTQPRLNNILSDLRGSHYNIHGPSGQQNIRIGCHGGTAVLWSIDAGGATWDYDSVTMGNDILAAYKACYSSSPSGGDQSFASAFQIWGPGWNILTRGSESC